MATHAAFNAGRAPQGLRRVKLEAGELSVEVVPELGGKITSIRHRGMGREFLWRDDRLPLAKVPPGAGYDDHFLGGFDELLPNDLAETVGGRGLADHGELWTLWLRSRTEGRALVLEGTLPVTPLSYLRRMEIEPPETLRLDYRLVNEGRNEEAFLWKLHPALRVAPGARIEVPARRAAVADSAYSRFSGEFAWPPGRGPDSVPLRADLVPSFSTRTAEFLYLTGLERGEAALIHEHEGWAFRMEFPAEVFRSVWVFASYGGWLGHEVLILEPCTAWPISLAEAAARGQSSRLAPGEALTATVRVRVGGA